MSQSELNRALVMQRVVEGQLTIQEAAQVLGLSERQIKRLKKKVLKGGAAAGAPAACGRARDSGGG